SAYVGGMFLNDAFDWAHDIRERPDRPIPSGRITVRSAVGAGVALLATSLVAIIADGALHGHPFAACLGASSLALTVFVYDAWHKGNDMAPVMMGLCRALVYVCAALAISGRVSSDVGTAAAAMLAYVAGLSEISRSSRFSI